MDGAGCVPDTRIPRPHLIGEVRDANCELTFLSLDTRTPYAVDYTGEGGGKTAHYMLRWVATTGAKGPWSETASATIGA